MDTEALSGGAVQQQYTSAVFAVAGRLASVLLYNAGRSLDVASVERLGIQAYQLQHPTAPTYTASADVPRVADMDTESLPWTDDDLRQLRLPPLMWAMHDAPFDRATAQSECIWIRRHLVPVADAGSSSAPAVSAARLFPGVDCFPLFPPWMQREPLLQNATGIAEEQLTVDFRQDRDALRRAVLSEACPRWLRGRPLTGADVSALARLLIQPAAAYRADAIPSLWPAFLRLRMQSAIDLAVAHYRAHVQSASEAIMADAQLLTLHEAARIQAEAILLLRLPAPDDHLLAAKRSLKSHSDRLLSELRQRNAALLEMLCVRARHDLEAAMSETIQKVPLPHATHDPERQLAAQETFLTSAFIAAWQGHNDSAIVASQLEVLQVAASDGTALSRTLIARRAVHTQARLLQMRVEHAAANAEAVRRLLGGAADAAVALLEQALHGASDAVERTRLPLLFATEPAAIHRALSLFRNASWHLRDDPLYPLQEASLMHRLWTRYAAAMPSELRLAPAPDAATQPWRSDAAQHEIDIATATTTAAAGAPTATPTPANASVAGAAGSASTGHGGGGAAAERLHRAECVRRMQAPLQRLRGALHRAASGCWLLPRFEADARRAIGALLLRDPAPNCSAALTRELLDRGTSGALAAARSRIRARMGALLGALLGAGPVLLALARWRRTRGRVVGA